MAEIQKKAWKGRKGKENGAGDWGTTRTKAQPALTGRKLAAAEVAELAKDGARARLVRLEKEIDRLRIFLG